MWFKKYVQSKFYFLKKRIVKQRGQIGPNSELGRWITLLSSLDSVKNIVEFGVWNGRGSSLCILQGVEKRIIKKEVSILGFEINKEKYEEARKVLRKSTNYVLLYGGILDLDDNFLELNNLTKVEDEWWVIDQKNLETSSNYFTRVPLQIDLLILDGGEFTSYSEFKKLESRCKGFIVLDDIKVRKNRRVHFELSSNFSWACITSEDERNGYSIWRYGISKGSLVKEN